MRRKTSDTAMRARRVECRTAAAAAAAVSATDTGSGSAQLTGHCRLRDMHSRCIVNSRSSCSTTRCLKRSGRRSLLVKKMRRLSQTTRLECDGVDDKWSRGGFFTAGKI